MHDYCSTDFNSTLTLTQSGQFKRLQALTLKAKYGYNHSYHSSSTFQVLPLLRSVKIKVETTFPWHALLTPALPTGSLPTSKSEQQRSPLLHQELQDPNQTTVQFPTILSTETSQWQGRMRTRKQPKTPHHLKTDRLPHKLLTTSLATVQWTSLMNYSNHCKLPINFCTPVSTSIFWQILYHYR